MADPICALDPFRSPYACIDFDWQAPVGDRPDVTPRAQIPLRDRPPATLVTAPLSGPNLPAPVATPISTATCQVGRPVATQAPGLYNADATVPGEAVLTFDDGPHEHTPELLDILAAHGVQGSFFVCGNTINADNYHLIGRMLDEGHIVANHTYEHDVLLPRSSGGRGPAYVRAQYQLTQAMVDIALLARDPDDFTALRRRLFGSDASPSRADMTGNWVTIQQNWDDILAERAGGEHPHSMVYTRPPGGSPYVGRWGDTKLGFSRTLNGMGILNIMWHSEAGESSRHYTQAQRNDPQWLANNMRRGIERGGVILIHDRINPAGLELFLQQVEEAGQRIVSLDEAVEQKYSCSAEAVSQAWATGTNPPAAE